MVFFFFSGNQLKCVQCVAPTQVATLRATWGEPFGYKEPYPYKEKKLNPITEFFDISKKRFNENTKVLIAFIGKNKRSNLHTFQSHGLLVGCEQSHKF